MARFTDTSDSKVYRIDKWLGVNESVGKTQLKRGEAVRQVNFRITPDYKPQKRTGHNTYINFANTKPVQGLWQGSINEKDVFIAINDGKVYERDLSVNTLSINITDLITEGAVKQIGTLTDSLTTIFYFESKLYFLNGEYKEYDGTTFQDVIPYVPTIAIATPPTGGGTDLEQINLLTGSKKQEFQGDGTAVNYTIRESNIDTDCTATVDGTPTTVTTDRILGIVTFSTAPANGSLVTIEWTKVDTTHANLVKKNKYAMIFGPGNDTAVFLWGNPEAKNRRTWSGTLRANYFPVFNFTLVGSDEYAITDIKPVYNRQIIFKQDRTHYSVPEYISETQSYDYPVYDLNERVGNIAFGGVQIVKNLPISLKGHSMWYWNNTSVEDERNAEVVSDRLKQSLRDVDLSQAVTFDNQTETEYWCNIGSKVYIWNYGNNTFYVYDNISATCFIDALEYVFYGSYGTIEQFRGRNDNGVAVVAQIETGVDALESIHTLKNSDSVFMGILPESPTSVSVYYRTNRLNEYKGVNKKIEYILLDFNYIDFDRFSFLTNRNPQSYHMRIRAKNYTYIQFMFENMNLDEPCVLLEFILLAEEQGEMR